MGLQKLQGWCFEKECVEGGKAADTELMLQAGHQPTIFLQLLRLWRQVGLHLGEERR